MYIVLSVACLLIVGIVGFFFLKKAPASKNPLDPNNLSESLKEAGYQQTITNNCIKYQKTLLEEQSVVEIEVAQAPKRQTRLDIDVYKDAFTIAIPSNVSASFLEYVVFRNYNASMEEKQLELLPNQDGTYFFRSVSTHTAQDPIRPSFIEERIQKMVTLFNDFPFITKEDYDHPLFQALLQDDYTCSWEPQLMMVRFTKIIDETNISLYFVKALKSLFISASAITDALIQEDFRDDQTQLHHFNKDLASDTVDLTTIFPSFEEFKALEEEFCTVAVHSEEEE